MSLQRGVQSFVPIELDPHLFAHGVDQTFQKHLHLGPVIFQIWLRRNIFRAGQKEGQLCHFSCRQPHFEASFQRLGDAESLGIFPGGPHHRHTRRVIVHIHPLAHAHKAHCQRQYQHAEGVEGEPPCKDVLFRTAQKGEEGGHCAIAEKFARPALHHAAPLRALIEALKVHLLLQNANAAAPDGGLLPFQGAAFAHPAVQADAAARQIRFQQCQVFVAAAFAHAKLVGKVLAGQRFRAAGQKHQLHHDAPLRGAHHIVTGVQVGELLLQQPPFLSGWSQAPALFPVVLQDSPQALFFQKSAGFAHLIADEPGRGLQIFRQFRQLVGLAVHQAPKKQDRFTVQSHASQAAHAGAEFLDQAGIVLIAARAVAAAEHFRVQPLFPQVLASRENDGVGDGHGSHA